MCALDCGMLEVRPFVNGGFAENSYLLWRNDASSTSAIAIDPGADAAQMIALLQEQKRTLAAILLTHAHIDHIEGVAALKHAFDAAIYMHPDDAMFYDNAATMAAQFGLRVAQLPPVDRRIAGDEMLDIAGIALQVRYVPGHSPGHVLFYVAEAGVAFVGDVVFQNSIGRTDLPGGSYQQLMRSIREHVMTLPDDTVLYSGHGPATTVATERASNPFIAPMYGGSFA